MTEVYLDEKYVNKHIRLANKEGIEKGKLLAKKEEIEFWDKQVGYGMEEILERLRKRIEELKRK